MYLFTAALRMCRILLEGHYWEDFLQDFWRIQTSIACLFPSPLSYHEQPPLKHTSRSKAPRVMSTLHPYLLASFSIAVRISCVDTSAFQVRTTAQVYFSLWVFKMSPSSSM